MQSEKLRPSVDRLDTSLVALTLALVANSAYLAAFGDPNILYVANSLIHPVLGIVVAVLFAIYLSRHGEDWAGSAGRISVLLLALGTVFGGYLMVAGMTRPNAWALYAHVSLTIVGLFLLLVHLRDRILQGATALLQAWRWSVVVIAASAAFYVAAVVYHRLHPNPNYTVRNPATPPLSMEGEGGGAASFMFPSSAQTPDGKPIDSTFFMNSESCKKCHEDIYNQWFSSMHHFASFNNQWYRKS
ncbi:MAG: hypothetical protein HYS61_05985, partial [Acidobacteria bacterium]|nr:hypothetical protein [Acidobacteriota bacterium]